MRFVLARFEKEQREEAYRIYITDAIYYYARKQVLNYRYSELFEKMNVDNRTGDEVAADIINRIGLRFNDECI